MYFEIFILWSGYGDTAWYLVVQGQYRAFVPVYIEKVEIWSDVTIAGRTDKQTNKQGKIELLSQWTMEG